MRGRELIPGKPVCPEFSVVKDLGISGAADNQMNSIIGGYFRSALVHFLRTRLKVATAELYLRKAHGRLSIAWPLSTDRSLVYAAVQVIVVLLRVEI